MQKGRFVLVGQTGTALEAAGVAVIVRATLELGVSASQ